MISKGSDVYRGSSLRNACVATHTNCFQNLKQLYAPCLSIETFNNSRKLF